MVRVVIVGCDFIAESHLKGYQQLPSAEVVAVADVEAHRARRLAALAGGVRWATDFREVIGLGDAVDICATSASHVEIGVAAAEAGKHIQVEKPFALTAEEAETLWAACARAGVKVMAGQTERFKPVNRALKDAVARGEIGRLVLARLAANHGHFWPGGWQGWQIDPAQSGGIFMHLGIHAIDLLVWLFDRPPRSIYAQTQKRASSQMDTSDYYQFVVRFQDDATAIGELSYALPRRSDAYRFAMLVGTRGTAYHRLSDDGFWFDDTGMHFSDEGLDPPIARQVAHFVECIARNADPLTTLEQIRTALRLALAADESSRTGQVVEIE